MEKTTITETTLGEWIAALTEAAAETLPNSREAYLIVSLILHEALAGRSLCSQIRCAAPSFATSSGEPSCDA